MIILDRAKEVTLYFRINRNAVPRTIVFRDADGNLIPTTGTFNLFIKRRRQDNSNLVLLTPGSGLTVNATSIVINPTASQLNIPEGEFYYELYNLTDKTTWLCGDAFPHKGKFDTIESNLTVEMISGTPSGDVVRLMGGWDASTGNYPSGVGSGAGGLVERANVFEITVGGIINGVEIGEGAKLMARVTNPGNNWDDWRIDY